MTSSFQPPQPYIPDISKFDWEEPSDLTKSLEENSKSNIADFTRYIQGRIQTSNAMHKLAEEKNKDLIKLTATGIKVAQYLKERKEESEFASDYWGLEEEGTAKALEREKELLDNDIVQTLTQRTRDDQTSQVHESIVENGRPSPDLEELLFQRADMGNKSKRYIGYNLATQIPRIYNISNTEMRYLNGRGEWITRTLSGDQADFEQGLKETRMLIYREAKRAGLSDNDIKHYLTKAVMGHEKTLRTTYVNARRIALDTARENEEKEFFINDITAHTKTVNDKTDQVIGEHPALASYIARNKGKYILPSGKYDMASLRKDYVDKLVEYRSDGLITQPDLESILNSYPNVAGNLESKKPKRWREMFPKEANLLINTNNAAADNDLKNKELEKKAEGIQWYLKWRDGLGNKPATTQQVITAMSDAQNDIGFIPEELKKHETQNDQDSTIAYAKFLYDWSKNPLRVLTVHDTQGIEGDDLKNALNIVRVSQQNAASNDPYGQKDLFLTGAVGQYLDKTLGERVTWDLRTTTLMENTENIYNKEYAYQLGGGQTPGAARTAAEKAVENALEKPRESRVDVRFSEPLDPSRTIALQTTLAAIEKDPNIVDSTEPMPGEKAAILEATKWYKNGGPPPQYYKLLAEKSDNDDWNWKTLMDHRYKLVTDNDVDLTQLEKDVLELKKDAIKQLNNKPDPSKTLRVSSSDIKAEQAFLNSSQVNKDKGGYDYISTGDKDEPVELDKPLTTHTIREVLEYIADGEYRNFGMYNVSAYDLTAALMGMSFNLEDPFDQKFQDKLMRSIQRSKSNKLSSYRGIDSDWNALVNIDDETMLSFQKLGNNDPFNQPNMLNQDAAMAVVDMLAV